MNEKKITILTCYFKDKYSIPKSNIYFPIQCGSDYTGLDLGIIHDNTGENISSQNKYWSEITGIYWAWKNMKKSTYIGLCSYRRFFNFSFDKKNPIKIKKINEIEEVNTIKIPNLDQIFSIYDIIIPIPYTYAYPMQKIVQKNYNQKDFEILEKAIKDVSPEYSLAYKKIYYSSNTYIGHNMFIMKWELFQEYCEWVFSILFEAKRHINPENYPITKVRVFGYMHELLLSVFIEKKKLKSIHSQLTWFTDTSEGFKFNSPYYRILCNIYYYITKKSL